MMRMSEGAGSHSLSFQHWSLKENTKQKPLPDRQLGSQLLAHQLQDFWMEIWYTRWPVAVRDPMPRPCFKPFTVIVPVPRDSQPFQTSCYSDSRGLWLLLPPSLYTPKNLTAETTGPTFDWFSVQLRAVPKLHQALDLKGPSWLRSLPDQYRLCCEALALWANVSWLGQGLAVCHQNPGGSWETWACCDKVLQLLGDKKPLAVPRILSKNSWLGIVGSWAWKNTSQRTWQAARSLQRLLEVSRPSSIKNLQQTKGLFFFWVDF